MVQDFTAIDLILYSGEKQSGVLKPDYLGVLGIHVVDTGLIETDHSLMEINKSYDMEVRQQNASYLGIPDLNLFSDRLPVVLLPAEEDGLYLKLRCYDTKSVDQWISILNQLLCAEHDYELLRSTYK